MYDNLSATQTIEQPRQIMTQAIGNEFNEMNKYQSELLSTIESKLHQILNLRQPEKGNDVSNIPNIPILDFAKHMEQQLSILRTNNNRLNKIIDHLNQIV